MKKNAPSHNAYVVNGDGEKRRWTQIGAAWPHKDGKGLNITLDALPHGGQLVLRPVEAKDEQGGAQ